MSSTRQMASRETMHLPTGKGLGQEEDVTRNLRDDSIAQSEAMKCYACKLRPATRAYESTPMCEECYEQQT